MIQHSISMVFHCESAELPYIGLEYVDDEYPQIARGFQEDICQT